MSITYVIPTHKCNLTCNHCDLRLQADNFNEEEFYKQLIKLSGEIIIFGGEPFTNLPRLEKVLHSNKNISSISSNMLLWNTKIENILSDFPNITIASSWNPSRFTDEQYTSWLLNLVNSKRVNNINITLTDDLFAYDTTKLVSIIKDLDRIETIKTISFEPLVPDYNRDGADEFLCKIYDLIREYRIKIDLRKIFGKKYCKGIQTLLPSGELINDCPQWYIKNNDIFKECFDCKLLKICKPCKKICSCSFPKAFYKKLQDLGEI